MTNKKIEIMNSSKQLFIERGITYTSIDDIAKTCKISKATFYKYFSSKEDLISNILDYSQNTLINACKSIDSNLEIDSKEKLRQKIMLIWEYKYKNYDFNSYVTRVFSKSNEDEINNLQKINRSIMINEYKKNLFMVYKYKIKDIIWDLIFIIDGLIFEFIILMRLNKQNFNPDFIADFIISIIENSIISLSNKKSFITKEILYGTDAFESNISITDYKNYFSQKLKELNKFIDTSIKSHNKNKLLEAIKQIEIESKNNNYTSLIIDAMLAFLGKEKELQEKVDLLIYLKDKIGDDINE